jgi:hypothetical protein
MVVLIGFSALNAMGQDTAIVQDNNPQPHVEPIQKSPTSKTYVELGLGLGSGKFRDFATSPLFYSGAQVGINLAVKLDKETHETYYGLNYSIGNYSNITGSSYTSSLANVFGLYYQRLIVLKQLSNLKWKYKVGGQFNATGTYRYNPSLQNNSVGMEMVNTLFISGKVSRDVSRTMEINKKFLFIKYHLKPRARSLSFQLNMGVMNNNFRNGYAYIDQSSVVNNPKTFGGYEYHWFEGFRMSSSLDYTIHLHNANAIQISYLWDAFHTGGHVNRYEMGIHSIRFSILFKTN